MAHDIATSFYCSCCSCCLCTWSERTIACFYFLNFLLPVLHTYINACIICEAVLTRIGFNSARLTSVCDSDMRFMYIIQLIQINWIKTRLKIACAFFFYLFFSGLLLTFFAAASSPLGRAAGLWTLLEATVFFCKYLALVVYLCGCGWTWIDWLSVELNIRLFNLLFAQVLRC